jgi:hypothetical protein
MICCYMPVFVEAHPVMIADQSAKKWNHHYHPQSNQPTVADGAAHSYGPRVSAERAARAMEYQLRVRWMSTCLLWTFKKGRLHGSVEDTNSGRLQLLKYILRLFYLIELSAHHRRPPRRLQIHQPADDPEQERKDH